MHKPQSISWTAGLLAGLHEFPTLSNVPLAVTSTDLKEIPHTLLSTLLVAPPQPYSNTTGEVNETAEADATNSVKITKITPGGEVVHIFSHIKKTYRLQWVILEGGGSSPPMLRSEPVLESDRTQKKSGKAMAGTKQKTKCKGPRGVTDDIHEAKDLESISTPSHLRWIPIQEVSGAKYVYN